MSHIYRILVCCALGLTTCQTEDSAQAANPLAVWSECVPQSVSAGTAVSKGMLLIRQLIEDRVPDWSKRCAKLPTPANAQCQQLVDTTVADLWEQSRTLDKANSETSSIEDILTRTVNTAENSGVGRRFYKADPIFATRALADTRRVQSAFTSVSTQIKKAIASIEFDKVRSLSQSTIQTDAENALEELAESIGSTINPPLAAFQICAVGTMSSITVAAGITMRVEPLVGGVGGVKNGANSSSSSGFETNPLVSPLTMVIDLRDPKYVSYTLDDNGNAQAKVNLEIDYSPNTVPQPEDVVEPFPLSSSAEVLLPKGTEVCLNREDYANGQEEFTVDPVNHCVEIGIMGDLDYSGPTDKVVEVGVGEGNVVHMGEEVGGVISVRVDSKKAGVPITQDYDVYSAGEGVPGYTGNNVTFQEDFEIETTSVVITPADFPQSSGGPKGAGTVK